METKQANDLNRLKDLIHDGDVAMLCTIHGDHIHSRPMATSDIDDEGNIWFFTNEFSGKVQQLEERPKICLAYAQPDKQTYVSINGYAELINDAEKMKELYTPVIKAFFPEGLDDPKLALLKVSPYQAEFWDSQSNAMVTFFQMMGAALTGKPYDASSEHGKINL